jgi:DinB family protein
MSELIEVNRMTELQSVGAILDALERAPNIIVPLVREVPSEVLKRRPKPGKWSAHEHACHLAVVHGLFFARLEYMLTNPAPVITPYDPGTQDADDALLRRDLDESLEAFVQDRKRLVARLKNLSPSDWARTGEHGEYSHYSVFIMFRHLALHDFLHAYRIEELLLNREWAADWKGAGGRRHR